MTVAELARKMRTHFMGGDSLAWDEAAETLWTAKAQHLRDEVERNLVGIEGKGGAPLALEDVTDEQWGRFIEWDLRPAMQVLADMAPDEPEETD